MKLSSGMIGTAALAVFLLTAVSLNAETAATPPGVTSFADAADSTSASGVDLAAPMPAAQMGPALPYEGRRNIKTPRFEWFLGYSYLRAVPSLDQTNRLYWLNGGSTSIAWNVNRSLGLVADFGGFGDSKLRMMPASTVADSSGSAFTYLIGPRLSFRKNERFTPFAQVLFGGVHAGEVTLSGCTDGNCVFLPAENKFGMTAGGGLDIKLRRHLAIRIVQAEYLMTGFEDRSTGQSAKQNDIRLSSGIVFRFGGSQAPQLPPLGPVTYSCSVTPTTVFTGETLAASGTAVSLNPARTAVYTWTVDGGTVVGNSSSATIDTANLAAGAYTLKGHISEGDKPGENADCSAPYLVKAYEPPTVSCSSDPSAVVSGATSTITATAISPQNRPLTFAYTASSGAVSGSSATAVLSTAGASIGAITVTCKVADDKGQTAASATTVTVAPPVEAAKPVTNEMCSIHFDRDPRRPARVDNEGKACLDAVALKLQRETESKLAIVGNANAAEKQGAKMAAERAANTKAYLVREKGIDSSRITAYTGSQDERSVSTTLIPEGATFDTKDDVLIQ